MCEPKRDEYDRVCTGDMGEIPEEDRFEERDE